MSAITSAAGPDTSAVNAAAEDGTWGRDYQGHLIPRHVGLGWSHGRRYQGGTGSYDPDGHPVPDVIGLTASKIRNH